jgi:hypothetical protein
VIEIPIHIRKDIIQDTVKPRTAWFWLEAQIEGVSQLNHSCVQRAQLEFKDCTLHILIGFKNTLTGLES